MATQGVQIRVVRGSAEVGGSCVELRCDGATVLLDAGSPLEGEPDGPLRVIGVGEPGPPPRAAIVSHGHRDHWGRILELPLSVPVWIGRGAADILRAAQFWGSGVDLRESGHLVDRTPFRIGPFEVTRTSPITRGSTRTRCSSKPPADASSIPATFAGTGASTRCDTCSTTRRLTSTLS